jgi:hypothetical protein
VATALIAVLLAYGVWLYWLTRGTTFWQDEWAWVLYRRGNDLGTFLRPHNQHLSLVPLLIYRLLLTTVGARDYGPYRALVIGEHLALVALVLVYARRRVGDYGALVAGALVLCLGAGWGVFLWPFESTWLTSLIGGLGALLMLDRDDRRGEVGACALLALSLASSGLGLTILLGLVVELAWARRWRRLWVVVLPAVVYGVWWLSYQQVGRTSSIGSVPRFLADQVASTVASLIGLAGSASGLSPGPLLWVGRPLTGVAVVVIAWWLMRRRTVPPRLLGLAATLGSFWVLTAITRAYIGIVESWASRYLYVGGLFLVLIGVELARDLRVRRPAGYALGIALVAIVSSGSAATARGARFLRADAQITKAELGAMDIARPVISPGYLSLVPYFPFPIVLAGPYFSAERAYGTPASTPEEIAASSLAAREAADTELVQIHRVRLVPARPDRCVLGALTQPPPGTTLDRPLPGNGLVMSAKGAAVAVSVRRFGSRGIPIGRIAPGQVVRLRIAPDLASSPWHLEVASRGTIVWC